MNIPPFLKSRKFYAALVAVLLIVVKSFAPDFPLSEDEVSKVVYVLMTYILGTGLSDIRSK